MLLVFICFRFFTLRHHHHRVRAQYSELSELNLALYAKLDATLAKLETTTAAMDSVGESVREVQRVRETATQQLHAVQVACVYLLLVVGW